MSAAELNKTQTLLKSTYFNVVDKAYLGIQLILSFIVGFCTVTFFMRLHTTFTINDILQHSHHMLYLTNLHVAYVVSLHVDRLKLKLL